MSAPTSSTTSTILNYNSNNIITYENFDELFSRSEFTTGNNFTANSTNLNSLLNNNNTNPSNTQLTTTNTTNNSNANLANTSSSLQNGTGFGCYFVNLERINCSIKNEKLDKDKEDIQFETMSFTESERCLAEKRPRQSEHVDDIDVENDFEENEDDEDLSDNEIENNETISSKPNLNSKLNDHLSFKNKKLDTKLNQCNGYYTDNENLTNIQYQQLTSTIITTATIFSKQENDTNNNHFNESSREAFSENENLNNQFLKSNSISFNNFYEEQLKNEEFLMQQIENFK